MRVGAAHRIAVDAFGLDAFPSAALKRIINAQEDWTSRQEASD
jgi:hypothetical protein